MYVRYRDHKGVHQVDIENFILMSYTDKESTRYSDCHQMIVYDRMLLNLVVLMIKTKRLSVSEFESILPYRNYVELIQFDEEFDGDIFG